MKQRQKKKGRTSVSVPLPPDVTKQIARRDQLVRDLERAEAAAAAANRAVIAARASGVGDVVALTDGRDRAEREVRDLRETIQHLDTAIPEARETAGRAIAEQFIADTPAEAERLAEEIKATQAKCRDRADALTTELEKEEHARQALAALSLGCRVLAARFPGLTAPVLLPAPSYEDVLKGPLGVTMRPTKLKPFSVAHRASADATERRRETVDALRTYLDKFGTQLPDEARAALDLAGQPDLPPSGAQQAVLDEAERQAEAEQREVRKFDAEIQTMKQIPTSVSGLRA